MEQRAVLVTGFGNSGVTAVMDLLGECEGYKCPPQEFFLIQHPDGILALEDALVHSWSEFAPDWAIRRFRTLVDVLARPATRFRFGMDYDRLFCRDFRALAIDYSNELAGIKYEGHLMFRRSEMNRAEYFAYNMARRFKLEPVNAYFARKYDTAFVPDPARFITQTKELMRKLLRSIAGDSAVSDVALCLGASPYQVSRSSRYFSRSATVIVDRDPRDIYLSARSSSYMPREVGPFIDWYKSTRTNSWQGGEGKAIKIMFEDLVVNYDQSVEKLFRFLDIDPARHTKKKSILKPEASAKRIAKWKSYPEQGEIERIAAELAPYLWIPANHGG